MAKTTSSQSSMSRKKQLRSEEILDLLGTPAESYVAIVTRIEQDATIAELLNALTLAKDRPRELEILVDILGSRRARRAAPVLLRLLDHSSDGVRASTADALGKIGLESTGPALFQRYQIEKDDGIRRSLIAGIGGVNYKTGAPILVDALSESDALTRRISAWSLGRLALPSTRLNLESALVVETDDLTRDEIENSIKLVSFSE